jgi:hypothetical protein
MNYAAVIVAAASSFLLGGIWYSSAGFGPIWNIENGGQKHGGHRGRVFAVAILFSLLAAFAFAWLLGPEPELMQALQTGWLVGLGFVATSFGINYQFAQRSLKLWLIDAGYHALQFLLFGLILGLWH